MNEIKLSDYICDGYSIFVEVNDEKANEETKGSKNFCKKCGSCESY